jgi:hypothetical protein
MPPPMVALFPHASSASVAAREVRASAGVPQGAATLQFRFRIIGDVRRLRLPAEGSAIRADGLWQHSCFEAFLRADAEDSYYEFNFAPSGAWAAYRFSGRREGRSSPPLPTPAIDFRRGEDSFVMSATVRLEDLPELAASAAIHAGLAAVLEGSDGQLSWWALAHRSARPDFHDPETFSYTVRA